jgi:hypothetical protein
LTENPKKENNEQPEITKESFPSCSECAWKDETLAGVIPCEYCIRNPEIVSKRWNGPKELCIKNVQMNVPRDMYISKEMLEFFKIIISAYSKENEIIQAMLERNKRRSPNIYPPIWEHPYWKIVTVDNKTYQTTWMSHAVQMRRKDMLLSK